MSVERQWIGTAPELASACASWRRLPAVGVDTEFVRERTFFPGLGLIQISDGNVSALVDTVAIEDLDPLLGVLTDPVVTKIFHACGEDLEVLYHRFAAFPQPVFDTQVAATVAGLGSSPGYGRLVAELFAVELPKDETRTNWLRRPLSDAQQAYAALDVAYLVPAYRRLRERLRRLGREAWMEEELVPLFNTERFLPDPDLAYRRIGAWRSLAPRQLAALRVLTAWRERQARRRDLPRNFVLKEKTLVEVARRRPKSLAALAGIDSLHRRDLERYGATLLRLVEPSRRLTAGELPAAPPPIVDLTPYRGVVRRLRARVAEIADALSLPPELLATRKTIEGLLRRSVTGKTPVLPRDLRGWRREVVGEALLETLAELGRRSS